MFGIKALKQEIAALEETLGVQHSRIATMQNELNAVDAACVAVHDRSVDFYKRVDKFEKRIEAIEKKTLAGSSEYFDEYRVQLADWRGRFSEMESKLEKHIRNCFIAKSEKAAQSFRAKLEKKKTAKPCRK